MMENKMTKEDEVTMFVVCGGIFVAGAVLFGMTIESKNGKGLSKWREIAMRDSMVRTMKQKNR